MERKTRPKGVISISLIGLNTEPYSFEVTVSANEIRDIAPEFNESVQVNGTIEKMGRRIHLVYQAKALATLVCDRSLEEYTEEIVVDGWLNYSLDGELYSSQLGIEIEEDELRGLREDAQWIDITDDLRQDLAVALPMKRIAPAYREMEIQDLQTMEPSNETEVDDRWAALKKISEK